MSREAVMRSWTGDFEVLADSVGAGVVVVAETDGDPVGGAGVGVLSSPVMMAASLGAGCRDA